MKKLISFIIIIALLGGLYFWFNSYKETKIQAEQTEVNTVVFEFLNSIFTGELESASQYTSDDFNIYEKVFLGKLPEKLVDVFISLLPDENINISSQDNITELDTSVTNIYNKFEGNTLTQKVVIEFDPEIYNKILSFLNIDNQTFTSTVDVSVQKISGVWKVVDFVYVETN